MLWSLFKIVLFVIAIAAVTIGAGYLMESDGGVSIAFAGTEFTLGPLQTLIVMVIMVGVIWLGLRLASLLVAVFRFLNGDETAISRYFDRARERKGFEALADGMMALASGEARLAAAKATKAEKYLGRPELTNLLGAQAAEMNGDKHLAGEMYKRLLTDDRTRFVGVRGIMKQKLAEGDTDTAMKLAAKAFAIKPQHEATQDVLLGLQSASQDWAGARETLGAKLKYGALPRDVHRRRDAVLALGQARDILDAGDSVKALEAAIAANRLSPDLVPAAVLTAQGYVEAGKPKYATRVLVKAWQSQPHPDIAAAFAAILPDENATDRVKRFQVLTKHNPDADETKMLVAELHVAAQDFAAARQALGDLAQDRPTQRSLTLMAAIERGEGADDIVIRAWLARAVTAPRGPQWVCDKCNHIHTQWVPVCDNCSGFDTLGWVIPPEGEPGISGGLDMLPGIVAAPELVPDAGADLPMDADIMASSAEHAEDAEIIKEE